MEDGDWGNTTEKALQLFLKDSGYDVDFKQGVRGMLGSSTFLGNLARMDSSVGTTATTYTLSVDSMTNFQTGLVAWDFCRRVFECFHQGDGGKNTELFQEFLLDEEQEIKPDGSWGKKSATALQNFLKSQECRHVGFKRNPYPIRPCPNALVQRVTPESPQMSKTSC